MKRKPVGIESQGGLSKIYHGRMPIVEVVEPLVCVAEVSTHAVGFIKNQPPHYGT